MGLLAPQPIVLPYQELPGAISARALGEHYKLYLSYRHMLGRVDKGLLIAPRPAKHEAESELASLLWGQNFAIAGAYLHELFFGNLTAETHIRPMILTTMDSLIERNWGTREAFDVEFHSAGLQARGWVVLAVCYKSPEDLRIFALDAHDLGSVFGYSPLLVIDRYEHAYWSDFGVDVASYLWNIMRYVDWGVVGQRYAEIHAPLPSDVDPFKYSYDRGT
jgi:Fe-Mn family superoxide dismutase